MLVSLHGLGQIDSINTDINTLISQLSDATPAYLIATGKWPASRPFIVVSPQLKADGMGLNQDWTAEVIDEVVEYVKMIRTINLNKIYITGLSLGGQGCMIYGIAHPDKVAAMIVISGRTNEILDQACVLANMPMWMFHGTEDEQCRLLNSIDMYNAINACANPGLNKPHLTLFDAVRHNTPAPQLWNNIYDLTSGFPIYDWLLQFTKNDATNKPPYVNAGVDKKILVQDGPLYIFGDYFDADGSITSVLWSQTGGTSLALENVNSPILKVGTLQAGNFEFELRVFDNSGAQSFDKVKIEILQTPTSSRVTNFILMNGLTNQDIDTLVNEQVINKNLLGVSQFNIETNIPVLIIFAIDLIRIKTPDTYIQAVMPQP